MRIFRLVKDVSPQSSSYKILLLRKLTANSVIEKFGNFNRNSGSLSINIFRFLFWLSKKKNIFISWYANKIFCDILIVKNSLEKVSLNIPKIKETHKLTLKNSTAPIKKKNTPVAEEAPVAEENNETEA